VLGGGEPEPGAAAGGPGVGAAGQIFTGMRPAGVQGAATAGRARRSGDAASTRTTAAMRQAFRMEFILPIVGFHRLPAGNLGPVSVAVERRFLVTS
jgi:hypothetical protein